MRAVGGGGHLANNAECMYLNLAFLVYSFFFVGQEFKIPNRMITSIQHGKISNCSLTILYPCVLEYHFNMPIKKYYTVCCLSGILYCCLLFFRIVKNHICNKDTCTLCWCQFVAYFHSSPQKWLHRFLWSYIYK